MKNLKHLLCAAVCSCAAQSAWAQPNNPTSDAYSLATYWEDVKTTRWETAAVFAGATALGIHTWDWGSSKRFKTNPEGWFGKDTGSGGADKLGHAFISYAITNVLTDRPMWRCLTATPTTTALRVKTW